ncbi:Fic family protein [Sporosarcina sp. P17b]|uniref:Fic family protein n=1 Tax=Sporosarcina sp. P17b TaxID=2048260 RepID=UPI00117B861F
MNEAADRLAYCKAELNMLHPLREGNGRTIRIFLHAMIQSVTDLKSIRELFLETIQYVE